MSPAVAVRPDAFVLQTGKEAWDETVPHLEPFPDLWTVLRRPVFAVGTWNGDDYTADDLAYHEEAFPQYIRDARPWVTLNHAPLYQTPDFIEPDGKKRPPLAAVLGNVSRLYRNREPYETEYGHVFQPGELMLADFVNVPRVLKECLERGNFPRPSIGLEPDFEDRSGKVWPWILQHISFQGAEPEAVFTLDDVNRLYGRNSDARVLRFFRDESRATAGREARCKILTFNLGEPKMDEERIQALEAMVMQLAEAVKGIAAKMEGEPEPEPEEAPAEEMSADAEKEEEEFSSEGGAAAVAEAPAPAASAEPSAAPAAEPATPGQAPAASPDIRAELNAMKAELEGKNTLLADLEKRFEQLDQEKAQTEKEYRRRDLKQFVASRKSKIPVLLHGLAESILEQASDLEAKQKGGKVKTFSKDGKELGLTDSLKLFMDSQRPIQEALTKTVLEDLQAPTGDNPAEWNKETVAKEVKAFARRHKMDPEKEYGEAFKRCARIHGRDFLLGVSRAVEA